MYVNRCGFHPCISFLCWQCSNIYKDEEFLSLFARKDTSIFLSFSLLSRIPSLSFYNFTNDDRDAQKSENCKVNFYCNPLRYLHFSLKRYSLPSRDIYKKLLYLISKFLPFPPKKKLPILFLSVFQVGLTLKNLEREFWCADCETVWSQL